MGPVEARLRELGLTLPIAQQPAGARITMLFAKRSGNLLYLSGNGPLRDGQIAHRGKVGSDLTVEEGYEAARLTGLNLLAVIKAELGDLDRVAGFVKSLGFVNSAPGFTQQPAVLNGSAVGMAELPFNIPVEIETIVEIADAG